MVVVRVVEDEEGGGESWIDRDEARSEKRFGGV